MCVSVCVMAARQQLMAMAIDGGCSSRAEAAENAVNGR